MVSAGWYSVLVGLVAIERLAELVVAKRNMRWSLDRGGVETGFAHYPDSPRPCGGGASALSARSGTPASWSYPVHRR